MGKLAEIKTRENEASVEDFINSVGNEQQRKDSIIILHLMEKLSQEKPKMWGASMIGFGLKRYTSQALDGKWTDSKLGFLHAKPIFHFTW